MKHPLSCISHTGESAILIMKDSECLCHFVEDVLEKGYRVFEISKDNLAQKRTQLAGNTSLPIVELIDCDDSFIVRINRLVEDNLENPDFKMNDLADLLCVSRTVLYRKLKDRTGLSPINFVKQKRIEKAVELLNESDCTIAEISYKTGFCSPQYLSRVFKDMLGCKPSEYRSRRTA